MSNIREHQIADFLYDIINYSNENYCERLLSVEFYIIGQKFTTEIARALMAIIKERGYLQRVGQNYICKLTNSGKKFLDKFGYKL